MSDEYPSNSNSKRDGKPQVPTRGKRPTKKEPASEAIVEVERVVKRANVNPRVRKENFIQRTTKAIFGADPDGVVSYILWDVLIPAAKETMQDMVTQGIEMFLFPNSGGRSRRGRGSRSRGKTGVVSYGNMYRNESYTHRRPPWEKPSSGYSSSRTPRSSRHRSRLDAVVFETGDEAHQVLSIMREILEQYGAVTVADFYDIAGLENHAQATDNAWGWENLENSSVSRTRDGFEIHLPKSYQLDR